MLGTAGLVGRRMQQPDCEQEPLYTLRRSIVVSTWSRAALLRHLAKHRP
jgi:hypothetical protein